MLALFVPLFLSFSEEDTSSHLVRLEISSVPVGAQVYIDSILVGVTPVVVDTIEPREMLISIHHQDFEPWTTRLVLDSGATLKLNPTLRPIYGVLNLTTPLADSQILLDSAQTAFGQLEGIKVRHGEHVLEVHHPHISRRARAKVFIASGSIVTMAARFDYFNLYTPAYSLIFPGLGQLSDESKVEALVLSASMLTSLYFFFHWDGVYNSLSQDYLFATRMYTEAKTVEEASRLGYEVRAVFDSAQQALRQRKKALTAAFFIYGVSFLETLFFHTTTSSVDIITIKKDHSLVPKVSFLPAEARAVFQVAF